MVERTRYEQEQDREALGEFLLRVRARARKARREREAGVRPEDESSEEAEKSARAA